MLDILYASVLFVYFIQENKSLQHLNCVHYLFPRFEPGPDPVQNIRFFLIVGASLKD